MKAVPLLDLKAQFAPLREEISAAVNSVIESQQFVLGQRVETFEQALACYTGAAHAIGCASGTDALILALAASDVGEGDEVLTTPFSFFSTASCAYKVGARPQFADIDAESFNLDPQKAAEAMRVPPRTSPRSWSRTTRMIRVCSLPSRSTTRSLGRPTAPASCSNMPPSSTQATQLRGYFSQPRWYKKGARTTLNNCCGRLS